jgi:hypothetical protein
MANNWQNIVVQEGQSLYDIALQHYGNAEAVIDLVRDNGLQGVTQQLQAGRVLQVNTASDKYNKAIVNYYKANNVLPATQQGVSFEEVLSLTIIPSYQQFSYDDITHTYINNTDANYLQIQFNQNNVHQIKFEFTSNSTVDFTITVNLFPILDINFYGKSYTTIIDITQAQSNYIGLAMVYCPTPMTGMIKITKLS